MAGFPQVGDHFGRYRIDAIVGRGAMGVVFAAADTQLGRDVALKVLPSEHSTDDEFRQRFAREGEVLAAMDSPNIVQVYDFGEQDGCLYIATQLVREGDAGRLLEEHGALTARRAIDLTAQVARALDEAHQAGVLHRDVKPSNVLVRSRGGSLHAYLCDFGVARPLESGLTRTGSVVGTYGYLAPERCLGHEATVASDVYALGCLLVALLTGAAPYSGTDVQVAQHHLSSPPPVLEDDDPLIEAANPVIGRAMAKEPGERYHSAAAMAEELALVAAASASPRPVTSTSLPPPAAGPVTVLRAAALPPPPPRRRRTTALAAAIGAALLLSGAGVWALLLGGEDSAVAGGTERSTISPSAPAPTEGTSGTSTAPAPASESTAPAPVDCLDGSDAVDGRCPLPQGMPGLRSVFGSIAQGEDCSVGEDRGVKDAVMVCQHTLGNGANVEITYSQYGAWNVAWNHYALDVWKGYKPETRQGRHFFPVIAHSGNRYRDSMLYSKPVPFAATVIGRSPTDVDQGLALVERLAVARSDFHR